MRVGCLLVAAALAACPSRPATTPDGAVEDALAPDGVVWRDAGIRPDDAAPPDQPACESPPYTWCNGSCVDLQHDSNHCGACNNACDTSGAKVCVAGVCACAGGLADCGGQCADLGVDRDNCGACGLACAPDEDCSNGVCICVSCACIGLGQCGGACVDFENDSDNCGTCGNACDVGSGFVCILGSCTCINGWTDCGGTCVDTKNDPQNCGACGTSCGSVCINGMC